MYSNWKVFSKDSHPSGLPPQTGMASYISNPKENYKVKQFTIQEITEKYLKK